MADYKKQGLFDRYHLERADGRELDPTEKTFTLRYDKNDEWGAACRTALRDFAEKIHALGYVKLAGDLVNEINDAERKFKTEPPEVPSI